MILEVVPEQRIVLPVEGFHIFHLAHARDLLRQHAVQPGIDAMRHARKHSGDHEMHDTLRRLFQFKAWANDELLTALARLGHESPITRLAIKALSHTYVVDRIFIAHMTRKAHAYASANLSEMPTLEDLSADI